MADKKITEFDEIFSASTESIIPIVENGINYNIKKGNLLGMISPVISGITGDFIPLTGTTEGNPLTGSIEANVSNIIYNGNLIPDNDNITNNAIIQGRPGSIFIISKYEDSTIGSEINLISNIAIQNSSIGLLVSDNISGVNTNVTVSSNGMNINSSDLTSRGIYSEYDFTTNITDLDYTQKKYVDEAISGITFINALPEARIQLGQASPTSTLVEEFVLKNNLGETFSYIRVSTGLYKMVPSISNSGQWDLQIQSQQLSTSGQPAMIVSTYPAGPSGQFIAIRRGDTGVMTDLFNFTGAKIIVSWTKYD